jgi:hypothetical protein
MHKLFSNSKVNSTIVNNFILKLLKFKNKIQI